LKRAELAIVGWGADLQRNAVVGVFLRLLEYYKGLLFLTTNRLDAIDDAIVSRCIAVIKYQNPPISERLKIWRTQAELNGLSLTEDQLLTLAEKFECSGRDIKGLVRLTGRFCKAKNKQPEFADFQRLAAFRGM
jgi:AAA+ superfamily predicted ATPase